MLIRTSKDMKNSVYKLLFWVKSIINVGTRNNLFDLKALIIRNGLIINIEYTRYINGKEHIL